jgi:DNA sulfur modification protein DndB
VGKKEVERSAKFVRRNIQLLTKLGFEDIDGGREDFKIGGVRIDVCAGAEGTLLIMEAKSAEKKGEVDIRDLLRKTLGVKILIQKGIRNDDVEGVPDKERSKYRKNYDRLVIGLIGENYIFKEKDKEFVKKIPKSNLHLWNDDFVSYYEDEYKKIGNLARFSLFGELGIRKKDPTDRLRAPALMVEHGSINWKNVGKGWRTASGSGVVRYQFSMNPKEILEFATVARREIGAENAYQRDMSLTRINQIAKYINEGSATDNFLPNSIILAFDPEVNPHTSFQKIRLGGQKQFQHSWNAPNVESGILSFPRDYRCCWVVDGQHRLFAFANVANSKNIQVPIIAFQNLKKEKQAKMFLDINENQKPVSADLVWDLRGQLTPDEPAGIISRVVKKLNDDGILKNRIAIPSTGLMKNQTGRLKMANLCRVIKKLNLSGYRSELLRETGYGNPLYSTSGQKTITLVHKHMEMFYSSMSQELKEDWDKGNRGFVLSNSSGNVMMRIFEEIIQHSMRISRDRAGALAKLKPSFYDKYLQPLQSHFKMTREKMTKEKHKVTGEAGKEDYAVELIKLIQDGCGDKRFGGDLSETNPRYQKLVPRYAELVRKILDDGTPNWLEKASPAVNGRCASRALRGTDTRELYKQLGMGDSIELIRSHKDEFYPVFADADVGFTGTTDHETEVTIETALNQVNAKWVSIKYPNKPKKFTAKLVDGYLETIEDCLTNELGEEEEEEEE